MARILVTDDEESERLLIHTALERAGHELFFAPDGEQALERYMQGDIDVVVTDLVMPRLNGFRLIQELKDYDAKVCILAISGNSPEHLDRARNYGALATLVKPLKLGEFLDVVDELVRIRRKRNDPWGPRPI